MKFLITTIFYTLLIFLCHGQTIVQSSLLLNQIGEYSIVTNNTIYFNAYDEITNSSGIYKIDALGNTTMLLSSALLEFQKNGLAYIKDDNGSIKTMELSTEMITEFMPTQSDLLFLGHPTCLNNKVFFVGYDLVSNDYQLYSYDGVSREQYTFPSRLQNSIRLSTFQNKINVLSNLLGPPTQLVYFQYDDITHTITPISQSEYNLHPWSPFNGIHEINANGLIYTLNSDNQLSNNLTNTSLTCFEPDLESGLPIVQLVGNIDDEIYLSYQLPYSSISGIYKYPQDPNGGLCATPSYCDNTVLHFDGIDDNISFAEQRVVHDFTIGCWFKSETEISGSVQDRLFCFGNNKRFEIGIDINGNLWRHDSKLSTSDNTSFVHVRDGAWHHVAVVGSGNNRKIYLDFVEVVDYSPGAIDYGNNLSLGNWNGSSLSNQFFHGEMDEFRFFNIAMNNPLELNQAFSSSLDASISDHLLIYFNFEEGQGGENNVTISEAVNQVSGPNGILEDFDLSGENSNYICSDLSQYQWTPFDCAPECIGSTVDLSTGINFNDGSLLPIGQYDGGWQMIDGPDLSITYPRPGFVLQPWPSWRTLSGATYISPFANAAFNGQSNIPYLFERCFCVCETASEVTIDLKAYVDNYLTIGLYDDNGNLIEELIDHDSFLGDPATSTTTRTLTKGTYCLRAGLRNDGSTAMGMSIEAKISGAGLIESGCCSPFTFISGTVFASGDCNTTTNMDQIFPNIVVTLHDANGYEIQNTITDDQGYYQFSNIEPGIYNVSQAPIAGYHIVVGAVGQLVEINQNEVLGGVDFINCIDATNGCCATDEELSQRANEIIGLDILEMPTKETQCELSIKHPITGLYSCQFIGEVWWGDGTWDQIGAGDPIPAHDYAENGIFTISFFVYSINENLEFCHTEIIDLSLAYSDCCNIVPNFNPNIENWFKVYPNPTSEYLSVDLNNNLSGYNLKVINSIGTTVLSASMDAGKVFQEINISNLPSGTYILLLTDKDRNSLKSRFVKM